MILISIKLIIINFWGIIMSYKTGHEGENSDIYVKKLLRDLKSSILKIFVFYFFISPF